MEATSEWLHGRCLTAAGSKNSDTPLSGTHYVSAKMYGVSIFLPAFAAYGQGKNGIAFFHVYLGKVYQARYTFHV